jgi:hypothetical protein
MEQTEARDTELMPLNTNAALVARAESDTIVATAKQYPRDVEKVRKEVMHLALSDDETASSMFYTLPGKQTKEQKAKGEKAAPIQGATVRLAELYAYSWGNLRVETDIESIDDKYVTAVASVYDAERNAGYRVRIKKSIVGKWGRYSEDMITQTCRGAMSLAFREAVFKAIPRAYINQTFEACMKQTIGDEKGLVSKRAAAVAWFKKAGIDEAKLFEHLQVEKLEDIKMEHLVTLRGYINAIKDGDKTLDAIFMPESQTQHSEELTSKVLDKGKPAPAEREPGDDTEEEAIQSSLIND